MTYYAVTNDPNELMHFGIKGMKWGITRTPEQLGHYKTSKPRRQRSSAYNRAAAKLSRGMQNGIAKAQASWKEYNSPKNKAIRQHNKQEKQFEKHVQLARQGRLKYKGISDAEVQRITRRLDLERKARELSGNEKQSFVRRLNSSVQEGIISGVGKGTSSYIDERMKGRGKTTAKIKDEKRMAAYKNSVQGRIAQSRVNRAETRKVRAQAQRDADKAYYQMMMDEGGPIEGRAKSKAKAIIKGSRQAYKDVRNNRRSRQEAAAESGDLTMINPSFKEEFGLIKNAYKSTDWSRATKKQRMQQLREYRQRNAKNGQQTGAQSEAIREKDQSPKSNIKQSNTSLTQRSYTFDPTRAVYRSEVPKDTYVRPFVRKHPYQVKRKGRI